MALFHGKVASKADLFDSLDESGNEAKGAMTPAVIKHWINILWETSEN